MEKLEKSMDVVMSVVLFMMVFMGCIGLYGVIAELFEASGYNIVTNYGYLLLGSGIIAGIITVIYSPWMKSIMCNKLFAVSSAVFLAVLLFMLWAFFAQFSQPVSSFNYKLIWVCSVFLAVFSSVSFYWIFKKV